MSGWVWGVTLVGMAAVMTTDLLIIARRPREPNLRECSVWVGLYVGLALLFAVMLGVVSGPTATGQFIAGWITEYGLSADNLFVFVIIMAKFAVPRQHQQRVLMTGVALALLLRGGFIAAGAVAVTRLSWILYIFGGFLLYTAVSLLRQHQSDSSEFRENALLRWSRRVLPLSRTLDGARLTTRREGRRLFTPMLIVMIAIGTTDVLFALDSIPAIFGITQDPYLVFTANVFALMGLRQLYFLLNNLMDRLVYLSIGLAGVLSFIAVKLVLGALADNDLPFIAGGRPVTWAPSVPTWVSLAIIVGMLSVATVASLLKSSAVRRRGRSQCPEAGAAQCGADLLPTVPTRGQ